MRRAAVEAADEVVENLRTPRPGHNLAADLGVPRGKLCGGEAPNTIGEGWMSREEEEEVSSGTKKRNSACVGRDGEEARRGRPHARRRSSEARCSFVAYA